MTYQQTWQIESGEQRKGNSSIFECLVSLLVKTPLEGSGREGMGISFRKMQYQVDCEDLAGLVKI